MPLAPFVRIGRGRHPTIDVRALEAACPPPDDAYLPTIASPSALAAWRRARRRLKMTTARGFPCDVFVWGKGPAPDPRMTRIGGVPFLPRRIEWPSFDGSPATFLCQFDFTDSRDLVPALPAELLLVFVRDENALVDGEGIAYVWVAARETDIVTRKDVPAASRRFAFVEAWGVRHRTVDLPRYWKGLGEDAADHAWQAPVTRATKIGGVPYGSQDMHVRPPKGYLCQIGSVQALSGAPWPWANRRRPLGLAFDGSGIYGDRNQLMFGDMGEMTFSLGPRGAISVDAACG